MLLGSTEVVIERGLINIGRNIRENTSKLYIPGCNYYYDIEITINHHQS